MYFYIIIHKSDMKPFFLPLFPVLLYLPKDLFLPFSLSEPLIVGRIYLFDLLNLLALEGSMEDLTVELTDLPLLALGGLPPFLPFLGLSAQLSMVP